MVLDNMLSSVTQRRTWKNLITRYQKVLKSWLDTSEPVVCDAVKRIDGGPGADEGQRLMNAMKTAGGRSEERPRNCTPKATIISSEEKTFLYRMSRHGGGWMELWPAMEISFRLRFWVALRHLTLFGRDESDTNESDTSRFWLLLLPMRYNTERFIRSCKRRLARLAAIAYPIIFEARPFRSSP